MTWLLILLSILPWKTPQKQATYVENFPLAIQISTEKQQILAGEKIQIKLELKNQSRERISFHFPLKRINKGAKLPIYVFAHIRSVSTGEICCTSIMSRTSQIFKFSKRDYKSLGPLGKTSLLYEPLNLLTFTSFREGRGLKAGLYTLQVTLLSDIEQEDIPTSLDNLQRIRIVSNEIQLKIDPRKGSHEDI